MKSTADETEMKMDLAKKIKIKTQHLRLIAFSLKGLVSVKSRY